MQSLVLVMEIITSFCDTIINYKLLNILIWDKSKDFNMDQILSCLYALFMKLFKI